MLVAWLLVGVQCDRPRAQAPQPDDADRAATATTTSAAKAVPPSPDHQPEPAAARRPETCVPTPPPDVREVGSLTVRNPPDPDTDTIPRRMRTHTLGSLSAQAPRTWVGPPVPSFVPLYVESAELHLLESDGGRTIALYRDPYGSTSCQLSEPANCTYFVRGWDECGRPLWTRRLNDFLVRPDQLEIQDLRAANGVLYFNEACQTYSKEANGECSSLVAFDPMEGEVLWRTGHLVSNDEFILHGDYIIAGYGFTAEPDFVHIVRREDGDVVHRQKIRRAHDRFRIERDAVLVLEGLP